MWGFFGGMIEQSRHDITYFRPMIRPSLPEQWSYGTVIKATTIIVSSGFDFYFNLNRTVAVTYFEPAHARKVFPCFDEPLFKASFNISIIHDPEPYYALSNMPWVRCVVREDGLVETHFAPSVNMSSYLVAFAVVNFKYKESKTDSGVLVSCLVASKVFIWLVWQQWLYLH